MKPGNNVVTRTVTDEVDGYTTSVAGVEIESVRTGPGVGPSLVMGARRERFTFTSSKVGFPMLSRATIADDAIIVGHIRSSSPGSRWCEIDLEPGAVLSYGSGAEHTACNRPGLEFMFALVDCHQLLRIADGLGIWIHPPGRGEVHLVAPTAKTDLVQDAFPTFAAVAESGTYPPKSLGDEVLRAMAHVLAEPGRTRRVGHGNRIDGRQVAHACIDYADSIQRIPSISELCLVAHVSERRLRQAFVDTFGRPPSLFFRAWALNAAHRRLAASRAEQETVTRVATDLGFPHLGRFSVQYRSVYGETPSATLRDHAEV